MSFFTKKKNLPLPEKNSNLEEINHEIYKRNFELAIVNKTLSLLKKLYQISLLELDPVALSEQVTETVRIDLNLEIAGVLIYSTESDVLTPLTFSKSDRLKEALAEAGFLFKDITITEAAQKPFFKEVLFDRKVSITNNLKDVWGGLIPDSFLEHAEEKSHIKTTLLYPLLAPNKFIGVLLLGLNRDYASLNEHEKESIKSCIDVIAVALDKAYIYKELQDANEKLKSLDKLKTEFLSLASHQLRSPLTAIKGYASMVLEGSFGPIEEKAKGAVDRIFQSAQNLTKVVEDLLNVSKIEQGGMKYEMSSVDLEKMLADLTTELSVVAKNRGLALTFMTDDQKGYLSNLDPVKIRQVFLNLIDNSIKYTKEGFIKVMLSKKDSGFLIAISDSGMGMTEEIKATLFQKFNRGEGGKMNAGGSGLGLYLAKEIVEAHKGKVWVESPGLNKGSTFYVELPA